MRRCALATDGKQSGRGGVGNNCAVDAHDTVQCCLCKRLTQKGALYDAYKNYHGKDGDVLNQNTPTVRMNPNPAVRNRRRTKQGLAKNTAEYLAIFRDDIADFVQRAAVMDCVDIGIRERPPNPASLSISV